MATGESESVLKGHLSRVNSVNFSPDGSRVASGSADTTVRIWNVATGESESELKGHMGSVYSVVFSPDGNRVVSGSIDTTLHIWNVETRKSEKELRGHMSIVCSVVFSPDGSHIVSGSFDNTVRIWNVVTGESEAELKGHSDSKDSAGGFANLDRTARVWNIATGMSGAFSFLPEHALLQDGIYVHQHLAGFYISVPHILTGSPSLHLDSPWIGHAGSGLQCWLPPQYRNIRTTTLHTNLLCIALDSGQVLAVKLCCSDPPNSVVT